MERAPTFTYDGAGRNPGGKTFGLSVRYPLPVDQCEVIHDSDASGVTCAHLRQLGADLPSKGSTTRIDPAGESGVETHTSSAAQQQ